MKNIYTIIIDLVMLVYKREKIPSLNLPIPRNVENILEEYHKSNIHGDLPKSYDLKKTKEQKLSIPDFHLTHRKEDHIFVPQYKIDAPEIKRAYDTKFFKELYGFIDIKQKPALNQVYFEKHLEGKKPIDVLVSNLTSEAKKDEEFFETSANDPITSVKSLFMDDFKKRFLGKSKVRSSSSESKTEQTPETPKKELNINPVVLDDKTNDYTIATPSTGNNYEVSSRDVKTDIKPDKKIRINSVEKVIKKLEDNSYAVSADLMTEIENLNKMTKKELLAYALKKNIPNFREKSPKHELIYAIVKSVKGLSAAIESSESNRQSR